MAEDWIFRFLFCFSLARMAARRERIRIRAAPRLFTSSIFQTGVDLAASVQDFIHLIGCNGIQAAAKGIQLDQVKILLVFTKLAAA